MATDLYILTNAKFAVSESLEFFDIITSKLKALPLNRAQYMHKGKCLEVEGDWNYKVYQEEEDNYYSIWFDGPYAYFPKMFPNICYISTTFRYSTLYQIFEYNRVDSFRKDVFSIVKAVGGSEVIFVADNACDKLNGYLSMAWDNCPYEVIKAEMLKEFGQPVTDYSKLDYIKLNYQNITEFVFDDFKDLKQIGE